MSFCYIVRSSSRVGVRVAEMVVLHVEDLFWITLLVEVMVIQCLQPALADCPRIFGNLLRFPFAALHPKGVDEKIGCC